MPDPSYWPAVAALGLSIVMGGLLLYTGTPLSLWLSIVGLVLMVVSIYAWSLEPAMESAEAVA